MSKLLYIRGEPGSGKHTVGRLAAAALGWDYLWFHDLYRLRFANPKAIDKLVLPGLAERLQGGKPLVFTRPSRLSSTVQGVVSLAAETGYETTVVRLTASRDTLLTRILNREPAIWRVSGPLGLDEYLKDGGAEDWPGELLADTEGKTPEEVCNLVTFWAGVKRDHQVVQL